MTADVMSPVDFFESVYLAYQQAEKNSNQNTQYSLEIAGSRIQLRFTNSALIPYILPALTHQQIADSTSHALTICIWDTISTNTPLPARPWAQNDFIKRGEINGYNDDRIYIAYHIGPNILSLLDISRNLAIFWTRDANDLFPPTQASPLRPILHWWMRAQEIQLIHAASVGTDNGGVIIVGRGGSGKSTIALACLCKEMLYLGDDMVLISSKPSPQVFNIYNSAKADNKALKKLAALSPLLSDTRVTNNEKAFLFLQEEGLIKIPASLPIRAIIIPKITNVPNSTIEPASPIEGLRAIAPSTLFMLSGADGNDLAEISDIVKQVPNYHLQLGTCLEQIPDIIQNLLSN